MKIALTGGGTLGHVIPCLSVMDSIKKIDSSSTFFYIGSEKEVEKKYVEDRGVKYYPIKCGKLRRYFSVKNISDCLFILVGFFQALKVLRKEKPDVLFSKGGFVSVPPVVAAKVLKIRCITHESDRSMGLANKINSKFCEKVCLGFPNSNLNSSKYIYTGNPIRSDLIALKKEKQAKALIVVLGGSQGAVEINELIYKNLDKLLKSANIIHQAGRYGNFNIKKEGYSSYSFIDKEYASILSKASLVISRAGANTLSELISINTPMYLIPLSLNASRGDQIENAKWAEEQGCAKVMKKSDDFLSDILSLINDSEELRKMEDAEKKISVANSSIAISKIILNIKE